MDLHVHIDVNELVNDFIAFINSPEAMIMTITILIVLIAITFGLLYFIRKL